MIKDILSEKVLPVLCAASVVVSFGIAFATADYNSAAASASASASATATPVEPTQKPVEPTQKPVEPTQKPVEPTQKPVEPTQKPVEPTEAPTTAPTQAPTTAPTQPPVELTSYSLVGTLVESILGGDKWEATKALEMTQSTENANIYTYTVKDVEPGDYEYEVLKDHSWQNKYIGTGFGDSTFDNLKCKVTEKTDVVVTLNLSDMTLKTSVDTVVPELTDLSAATVTLSASSLVYNSANQAPTVKSVVLGDKTLVADTDYTVETVASKNVGTYNVTVTGKGAYEGKATGTYKIVARSIYKAKASVGAKTYTGKKLTSSVYSVRMVVNGKAATLKKNTEYTVKAVSRTTVGSSTVTFTGKGNFTGTVKAKFVVTPKKISSKGVTVGTTKTYTGKSLTTTVKVKDGKTTLKNGRDYTVKYKNNKKVGKATVTIKLKGNYTGTFTKTFKIVPGKASIKSVVNKKAGKATVTVKKVAGATGYKVSYKLSTAKKWKTVTVKGTAVNFKATKGKTYQVKVAAITKVGKKTVYTGSTSSTKKIKIKK